MVGTFLLVNIQLSYPASKETYLQKNGLFVYVDSECDGDGDGDDGDDGDVEDRGRGWGRYFAANSRLVPAQNRD